MQKVTILTRGGLGNIVAIHAKLIDHGRKPYAQYASAPFVKYVKKNARKPVGFVQTYDPYLVILDGWQDIESQSLWGKSETRANGVTVSSAKFSSFDSGWQKEFEAENTFTGIIADYRGVNAMEKI